MATLAFAAIGSAVGSSLLPAGISVLGTTVSGAAIGSQIGALAGSFVDEALFGPAGQARTFEGPRLEDLRVTSSSEGAPIPRVYGAARVGGQVIWATDFEEVRTTQRSAGGGQSKGGGGGGQATTTVAYAYYANFAIALAEGPITGVGRVWADGQEWNIAGTTHRIYLGREDQAPDALIDARLAGEPAPAYRGVAYVVFERLPIGQFGNRLPQLSFEVFRAVDGLHEQVKAAVIIPGSGEFAYATTPVQRRAARGEMVSENVHTREAATDWSASMVQLQRTLPAVASASLIVSWFGSDLRAASCRIEPRVERPEKETRPVAWQAAGQTRANAPAVSRIDERPAYGGTPSDASVIEAIRDLKARGIRPVLTPFILMDVAQGNTQRDPYSGAAGQPAYPWRGRITIDPAPGVAGTPDQTAAAADQVAAFVGDAAVSDFAVAGDHVLYRGPAEWGYRRFILHYAHLALAAGGVDAFLIGTEMRGLTWARDGAGSYPFVTELVRLAGDVKRVLGPATKVTYAADWSEYFGHQPADGSGDVYFHLDPLWAAPAIDAVGIDLYWPLADWRDGDDHRDAKVARSVYDLDYLKSNLRGGEGFDWYYASEAARDEQVRTPITDGLGKPWLFRFKDLVGWWSNAHFDRPGGIERAAPTAWRAQSKPVWLMEVGCPAVDKGANQPNVFHDPKSAESRLPYFAEPRRDDFMQRAYLRALIEGLDPAHEGYVAGANPASKVYAGRMVDLARLHVYAWDARPYPAFPNDAATWGDAPNWSFGHWLNGRIASMPLAEAVAQIFADHGFTAVDATRLEGVLPGYLIDRVMALREVLQPIEMAFFVDAVESGERIVLSHRGRGVPVAVLAPDELVALKRDAPLLTSARGQETELPATAKITYMTAGGDYRRAVAEARRLTGLSERIALASLAMMLEPQRAHAIAETWLHEAWAARHRTAFTLPPSRMAIEPGDLVETRDDGRRTLHRVTGIADRGARSIEALSVEPAIYAPHEAPQRVQDVAAPPVTGSADALFLDLPLIVQGGVETDGFVALHQAPWPGPMAIYRAPGDDGFELVAEAVASATIATLLDALPNGPPGRIDHATRVRVKLASGELHSLSRLAMLDGGNAIAVRRNDGSWEVCQFENAELVAPLTYLLSGFLRGQLGSEDAREIGVEVAAPGQPVVLIDAALARIDIGESGIGRPFNWRYGPAERDIGDTNYGQGNHAFRGIARRPFAPVHVRARRVGGDVTLTWVRRTRLGGDTWEQAEVALGEASEAYEVDILAGDEVVRTLRSATPAVAYPAADQRSDFGAPQASLACRVYQVSATFGRGKARAAVV